MGAVDYIDQLARLRLSRQQASVLTELYRLEPDSLHPWAFKPASRSESASTSRMLHRLRDRGYIRLMALPGRARYTHLVLTDKGRELAALINDTVAYQDDRTGLIFGLVDTALRIRLVDLDTSLRVFHAHDIPDGDARQFRLTRSRNIRWWPQKT